MILWLLLAIIPVEHVVESRVDVIELNHCYNERGEHTLSQWIFWQRYGSEYHVIDWRLADSPSSPQERALLFWDKKGHMLRRVRAIGFQVSHTQHDPELAERNRLPSELRKGLTQPLVGRRVERAGQPPAEAARSLDQDTSP